MTGFVMSREMSFAIFCIENYKRHRNLTGKQTVELFPGMVFSII